MPTKKEVKELSKDISLSIEWAAAEYNYIVDLKDELEEVKREKKVKKEIKELKKAARILRYVSRAERRAFRFEEQVEKKLEDIFKELSEHLGDNFSEKHILIEEIRKVMKEIDVEHDSLVKYASFYEGLLVEELDKARAEAKLEKKLKEDHPEKAQQIHSSLLQLIEKIQEQIKDADKWLKGLEASLRKAQEIVKKLTVDGYKPKLPRTPVLVYTDIGRDVDDLEALIYLAGSPNIEIVGVVTAHMIPKVRAQIARAVLNALGLSHVPVGVGSVYPLESRSSSELRKYLVEHQIEGISYEGIGMITKRSKQPTTKGEKIILNAVKKYKDQLVIAVLAPPTDLAKAVLKRRELFQKIAGFYFMGQALQEGNKLVADPKAYNFAQDMAASEVLLSLQDHVPMTFLTKFAAYATPLNRTDFAQFEKTDHPVGKYLMIHAVKGLECFVKRAPEIFKRVFQIPAHEDANEAFAKLQKLSNPYDALTVMAIARPELFSPVRVGMHKFIGLSLEATGVPNPVKVKSELMNTMLNALK